jgi:hypothetical protein
MIAHQTVVGCRAMKRESGCDAAARCPARHSTKPVWATAELTALEKAGLAVFLVTAAPATERPLADARRFTNLDLVEFSGLMAALPKLIIRTSPRIFLLYTQPFQEIT